MKKLYLPFIFMLAISTLYAQLDTVLFENFQINPFEEMDTLADGSNMNWVNFDADGLPTAFGTEESKRWFWGEFFIDPVDPTTGETNYIGTSLSFLEGFAPGNRNWLILPPIEVTDDSYMLHWESAPAQMPRYMDGYSVLVSTNGNDPNSFSGELFKAASMDEIVGSGQSIDYSNFTFTEGYLHADGGTLTEYFSDDGSGTILRGLLEPHSVSLADYAGQTIYIAFLHDSDDDERIGLDDILVTKSAPSNTYETAAQQLRMECYPSPADHLMNVNFILKNNSETRLEIINSSGQILQQKNMGELYAGVQQTQFNLSGMVPGNYFVRIVTSEKIAVQGFVKR